MEAKLRKMLSAVSISMLTMSLLLCQGINLAGAATCGYPNGPKTGTMIADVNEWKTCSTLPSLTPPGEFWMTLSNLPAGSQLTNGVHGSYCVDLTGTIMDNPQEGNIVYTVDFWSSLDPNLPNAVKKVSDGTQTYTIPWDKVNYLLNTYPNESWLNLQAAYWDLVHGCTQLPGALYTCGNLRSAANPFPFGPAAPYGCPTTRPVDEARVQFLVNEANAHGAGFQPGAGERIASVGQITNCSPAAICNQRLPYQVVFIPTTCPTCTGKVGDFVWEDLNGNGIQDAGEPGIPGVEVKLAGTDAYGQPINLTTVTDSHGKYEFNQLCTGDYRASVTASTVPAGLTATINPSANGNDNNPVDNNDPAGTLVKITTDSSSNLTVDFGYEPDCKASIGDYVWLDLNGNGKQDGGEPGIPNVKVVLSGTSAYGLPVSKTSTTDSNGLYGFHGLCQGSYSVKVDETTIPTSFIPTTSTSANGDDLVPFDSNSAAGTAVHLTSDTQDNPTVDFGYVPLCDGKVGNFVWKDLNTNGLQDSGEPGIAGVEVKIGGTNSYGQLVSMSATTNANGLYAFNGLCAGSYTLTVNPSTVPTGWIATAPLKTDGDVTIANDEVDSNAPNGTIINLAGDSAVNQSIDFGYVPNCTATVGDYVWKDLNQNGIQDDGAASGLDGIQVLLTGTNVYGQPVSVSALTGNGGYYLFGGLCQGNYTVAVNTATTAALGLVPTQPRSSNGDDGNGNDSNEPIGTAVIVPSDAASNLQVDFGFYKPCTGTIGDFAWNDLNQNGIQDAGEPGLAGVALTLTGTNLYGMPVSQSFTTLANGAYQFTGLCQGTYTVAASTPAGFVATLTGKGTPATDSNLTPATLVLAADDSSDQSVDFGYYKPCTGTIGDFAWNDLNQNGIQDAGEAGLAGVTLSLTGTSAYGVAVSQSFTTLANGAYQFTGLCPGTYTVSASTPAGFVATLTGKGTPATDSNLNPASVVLAADDSSDQSIDFGFYKPCTGTIGDFAWNDQNQNGIQDAGEAGLAGVTLSLTGTSAYGVAVSQSFTTLSNGAYQFTGLCQGSYTVSASTPAGFVATLTGKGTPATDSNPTPATVVLAADDSSDQSIDFGYYKPCTGSIGDFAWNDQNQNGIQDAGEAGLAGVALTLTGTSAYGVAVSQSFTTLSNGAYQFTGLCQGSYTVSASTPAGFVATLTGKGTPATDSNLNPATVVLATDDSSDQSVDFGYYKPCTGTIGDFAWNDLNQNGIQDAGEAGLAGVTLSLTGTSTYGVAVSQSFTTLANGAYQFTGLCQGSYTVSASTPAGFIATLTGKGTPATDSNGSPATVVLAADDSSDQSVDFGYYKPCTGIIGDFAWNDLNQNGIQDAGEAGLAGVTLSLSGTSAYGVAVSQSFTTLANGAYQFTGLCQGTYAVAASTPAGFIATLTGKGTTATDSNASPAAVVLATDSSSNQTIDFGYYQPCTGSIGDFAWYDSNQNGIQDPAEAGLAGVTLTLSGTSAYGVAVNSSFTTLASGAYQFTGLCQGTYSVSAQGPAGMAATLTGKGTAATDSNPSPSAVVLTTDSTTNQTIDFGFYQPVPALTLVESCTNASAAGQPIKIFATLTNTGGEALTGFSCSDSKGAILAGIPVILAPDTTASLTGSYIPTASNSTDTITCSAKGAISAVTVSVNSSATCDILTAACIQIKKQVSTNCSVTGAKDKHCKTDETKTDYCKRSDADQSYCGNYFQGKYSFCQEVTQKQTHCGSTESKGSYCAKLGCDRSYCDRGELVKDDYCKIPAVPVCVPVWLDADTQESAATMLTSAGPSSESGDTILSKLSSGNYSDSSNWLRNLRHVYSTSSEIGDPHDADSDWSKSEEDNKCSGSEYYQGHVRQSNLSYRFVVSNCGSTDLTRLVINDPKLAISNYAAGSLSAGATVTLTSAQIPQLAQPKFFCSNSFQNTATVTAVDTLGRSVTDSDDAWVLCNTKSCSFTLGYWKNHADSWPVSTLKLGNVSYTKSQLLSIFAKAPAGNGLITLAHQLIAAKLNVANGTVVPTSVQQAIQSADAMIAGLVVPPVGCGTLSTTATSALVALLDSYNSGTLAGGPTHCGDTPEPQQCTGSIGNFVWLDIVKDGVAGYGEPGLAGVKVTLSNGKTTTTDSSGHYLFSGLCQGSYEVKVTPPCTYISTTSASVSVTLSTNTSSNLTADFGLGKPSTTCTGKIGNYVWNDLNKSGIQDSTETGLAGVQITLSNGASTVSSSTGYYQFTGLCAGDYVLTVATPTGFTPSAVAQGSDTAKDSKRSPARVTLASNSSSVQNIDFGFYKTPAPPCTGVIGNYVWNDLNKNGIQDSTEKGIAGVVVKLSDGQSTLTDAEGHYQFTGLSAGTYTVTVVTPNGFTPSPTLQGTSRAADSNVNGGSVTLGGSSGSDLSVDFGFWKLPTPNPAQAKGCSLGYWKTHTTNWPLASHTVDNFDTVFGVSAFNPDINLLQALNTGGGGLANLARQATAALLNAEDSRITGFPMTANEVRAAVVHAILTGDYDCLASKLDSYNNLGCPLN
jgi:hypothetical protein